MGVELGAYVCMGGGGCEVSTYMHSYLVFLTSIACFVPMLDLKFVESSLSLCFLPSPEPSSNGGVHHSTALTEL